MRPLHDSRSPIRWLIPLALASVGAMGWACQDNEPGQGGADDASSTANLRRRAVLQSIADNVLVPSTAEFSSRAAVLELAVVAYADAVAQNPSATDEPLAAAQLAWRDAMEQWQRLEVMQVGPAAPSLVALGGEALRDNIYSWPTADSCSVDRALVDQTYLADDFFVTELPWAYGLDALEYLLFAPGVAHTCPTQVQLDGPWAALGDDERVRRRAVYAATVSAELAATAETLASRWSADDGDFGALLGDPRLADSPYSSDVQALDEVFRAMFYLDGVTKDDKLGTPLGLIEGCPAAPCVSLLETPWSGGAASAILANLQGLQWMIQGGPDPATAQGFDDLLVEADQEALSNTLLAQLQAAITAAEAFEDPLQQVISTDPDKVTALFESVKTVSDTLKGPFVIALRLTIPAEGAGDVD